MANELLKEGGPYKVKNIGRDRYELSISVPRDSDGRIARECLSEKCSPGYFKVKLGTGIIKDHDTAFCPYCRYSSAPNDFAAIEQRRYAKDVVMREVHQGAQKMIKDAFGLGASGRRKIGGGFISMELSYKPGSIPHVWRPVEEELKRDIICPNCGLDHSVYGLATWCADCGADIFLTHLEAELNVVEIMLNDIDRRHEQLGARVASKDLENSLEDVVSIFEAALKAMISRYLNSKGISDDDVDTILRKKIGNAFQSISRTKEVFRTTLGFEAFDGLDDDNINLLNQIFEKRHPITHNLGIVDKKYLERVRSAEREGCEIRVTKNDIRKSIQFSSDILKFIHGRLFSL
jgi:hypothetical protein